MKRHLARRCRAIACAASAVVGSPIFAQTKAPEPKLDGEALVIGAQNISLTEGLLSFSK